ncbi:hypothetical protein BDZ94DRAFT_1378160 [Collybia nuda]|uniref:Uncharacterized protein n=1 Tax=Collybia nuda TaxID=64659 RepID=A0A9P5XYX6_9AGAR|nr:hypothetical protein BDZ94DRAFT_1378160 [Collybia nuda]
MAKLRIKFQIPTDKVQDFLNGLGCNVDTLGSDLFLDLEPYPGSENLLDGTTAIHAIFPEPEGIYDELSSHFFHASLDSDQIVLKFASGLEVLEHMTREAAVYNMMKDLQGNVIPIFKGIYSAVGDPHTMCLITSDVENSIPAGGLVHLPEDDRPPVKGQGLEKEAKTLSLGNSRVLSCDRS